jgi:hypothetical protein
MNITRKYLVNLTLLVLLAAAATATLLAAEHSKNFRWTVDRTMQMAGQLLEPGRYLVQVTYIDNQKAQIVVLLKDRVLLKTDVLLEAMPEAAMEDGVRVSLPDGKTRVVQKLWFHDGRYLFNLENPTNLAVTDIATRP